MDQQVLVKCIRIKFHECRFTSSEFLHCDQIGR